MIARRGQPTARLAPAFETVEAIERPVERLAAGTIQLLWSQYLAQPADKLTRWRSVSPFLWGLLPLIANFLRSGRKLYLAAAGAGFSHARSRISPCKR